MAPTGLFVAIISLCAPLVETGEHKCGAGFITNVASFDEWINVTSFSELVFSFTSCYSGFISLSSSDSFPDDHLQTYELRVSNTEAHLYQCHACASNTLLDYCPVVTPSDLQCAIDTRAFWLAWDNDTVLMGEGDRLTQNPRLWREPLLHPILYVGFASQSAGAGIVWSLDNCTSSSDVYASPSPIVVDFNTTFITRKTTINHVLDASGVTALTFTTTSCYTVYVEAAESADDILLYDVVNNPVLTVQWAWSVMYVSRSPPYALLSSVVPSFGAGFNCYVDQMTLWANWTGGVLTLGIGSDFTSNAIMTTDLNGLNLNHFGFRATAGDTPSWTIQNGSPSGGSSQTTAATMTSAAAATTTMMTPTSVTMTASTTATVTTASDSDAAGGTVWQKQAVDSATSADYFISRSVKDRSDLCCARNCVEGRVWCAAFHYDLSSGTCHLLQSASGLGPGTISLQWIYRLV